MHSGGFNRACSRLPGMASGRRFVTQYRAAEPIIQGLLTGGETMMLTYERPTLTAAGSFKKVTGLGGHGPRDFLVKKQQL